MATVKTETQIIATEAPIRVELDGKSIYIWEGATMIGSIEPANRIRLINCLRELTKG